MLEHGGNLEQAMLRFGGTPGDWLDLSTGINPHGYLALPLSATAWHRLPSLDHGLSRAACKFYGAPLVLPVAGTQMAIQGLPQCRPAGKVVVASPCYAEHAQQWRRHGHDVLEVRFAQLDAVIDDCDVLVICNPNNPTGETIAPQRLLDWSSRLARRGGWLVVDQAFADIDPAYSVAAWSDRPGLIVLHSIGKFFGLAGLRLGFVSADSTILKALQELLGPWIVSEPVQALGRAALEDAVWQSRTRLRLLEDGRRLETLLNRHGIWCSGCALFQWWPEAAAEELCRHMSERRIWVRLFTDAARGIRIGLPDNNEAWQRLEQALQEWTERNQR